MARASLSSRHCDTGTCDGGQDAMCGIRRTSPDVIRHEQQTRPMKNAFLLILVLAGCGGATSNASEPASEPAPLTSPSASASTNARATDPAEPSEPAQAGQDGRCATDADCPAGQRCDPCGTSSCPECEDCIAACVPQ